MYSRGNRAAERCTYGRKYTKEIVAECVLAIQLVRVNTATRYNKIRQTNFDSNNGALGLSLAKVVAKNTLYLMTKRKKNRMSLSNIV